MFYITAKALSTIKQEEIIDKNEFTKATLDRNVEAFIIHVIFFSIILMSIYSDYKA